MSISITKIRKGENVGSVVLDGPKQDEYSKIANLKESLKIEMLFGPQKGKGASAYYLLKNNYGFRGSRQAVLAQVIVRMDELLKS